jgi:hypothetical protein
MSPECSLHVPQMFAKSSLKVPQMFHECSLYAPHMFPECSLDVPRTIVEQFLSGRLGGQMWVHGRGGGGRGGKEGVRKGCVVKDQRFSRHFQAMCRPLDLEVGTDPEVLNHQL